MPRSLKVDCCIVGGGPAGVMAGLLFARAGCRTLVLEKHADFLRDFRGDTVHPSTLEVMKELGLLAAFLERPHQRIAKLAGVFSGERIEIADLSRIPATCPFIAFMPQWDFLNFLSAAAGAMPTFSIEMQAETTGLIEEDGRINGVTVKTPEGPLEVRAKLVIGADGRTSTVRAAASLHVKNIGAPIDVLWFRIPREPVDDFEPLLNAGPGHLVVTIDRGEYDQCAFVIPKGETEKVKAKGIEAFREAIVTAVPRLRSKIEALQSFDEVKLLTVRVDRLERWSRPGLLMIGDGAHAMSPVGGVGINLAIQDAVAAANLLAARLFDGTLKDEDLQKVRARRLWPTVATQFLQVQVQNRILKPILDEKRKPPRPPAFLRLVSKVMWLKRLVSRLVGLGVRAEHVRSPKRHIPKI